MKNSIFFLRTPRYEKNLSFKFLIVLVFLFCFSFLLYFESGRVYALESNSSYSYEYDANGRLIRVKDKTGKIIFEYRYDHLGNIISNGKKDIDSGNQNNLGNQNGSEDQSDSGNNNDSSNSSNSEISNHSGSQRDQEDPKKSLENQSNVPKKNESKSDNTAQKDEQKANKIKLDFTKYEDIKNHWAKNEIAFVLERGYFIGTSDTSFSPSLEVDRAMMVTVLDRIEKSLSSSNSDFSSNDKKSIASSNSVNSNVFQDIKKDSYYAKSVHWAYSNKIMKGISKIHFAPTQKLTREQVAVILSNYLKFKQVKIQTDPSKKAKIEIKDGDKTSSWAKEDVELMVSLGILKGRTSGDFSAKDYVTRAEIAIVIKRIIALLEN